MMARVRGVIAASSAASGTANPSAAVVATGTGTPPAKMTHAWYATKHGSGTMTSSPGSISASITFCRASLTPTVISSSSSAS